ncbi:cysteine dioxygenase type 1-like [Uloborus diversus]|uniref:cysteine dioxygenase type 1-like n=1 Tax=Uloborus diversus TaxID=327109 RepID=UPI002409CAA1|nr:cysteine dioxygenase type 1-like [Uloborus diversus]XP_054723386.1 cysteine dioxygenase type 1-like [Uloborus diversus]
MAEIDYRYCFGAGQDVEVQKRMLTVPRINTLDDLIRELRAVFENDRVNVERVQDLMSAYKSNPREWIKFAKFDRHRYTRNLVDEGNGKYNLMLLAWAEGQGSSIHDHANSHCFMKMLDGSLREVRFAWPTEEDEEEKEMQRIGETLLHTNEVTYMNDSLGLHRVENPSHTQTACSLHLYSPAFDTVLLFDQRTGHKTRGKVTFWSKYGERTEFGESSKMEEEDYENN